MKTAEQKQGLIRAVQTHSMLSWRHVNLLGEYDFSDHKLKDSYNLVSPRTAA